MKTYHNSKRIMRDLILSITAGFICAAGVITVLILTKYEVLDRFFKLVNP